MDSLIAGESDFRIVEVHKVPADAPLQRIVDYANGIFVHLPSRKGVKKAIERKQILLNGQPVETGRYVQPGDVIALREQLAEVHKTFALDLEVLYEDDYLAVVHKPAGIPVSGNRFKTIAQALPFNLQPSPAADALRIALPVHRLDAPTSGLLLVAKTAEAMVTLGRQFAERQVSKVYHAVVFGEVSLSGKIDMPVEGKEAESLCTPLRSVPSLRFGNLTLLQLEPLTGRTHQLRIHMVGIGHPIVGDAKYGNDLQVLKGKGLFLAATAIALNHPIFPEREVKVEIVLPQKFETLLLRSEQRWQKYQA